MADCLKKTRGHSIKMSFLYLYNEDYAMNMTQKSFFCPTLHWVLIALRGSTWFKRYQKNTIQF